MKKNPKKEKPQKKVAPKKKKQKGTGVRFPASLMTPVANFLKGKLKKLEKTKAEIEKDDPFKDESRVMDNASPDTEAAEQFGHAKAAAINEELTKKIIQTKKALTRIKFGQYGICESCKKMIDTDRLIVYPEATLCAKCQGKKEAK